MRRGNSVYMKSRVFNRERERLLPAAKIEETRNRRGRNKDALNVQDLS
jgi:hypothetical protein